MIQGTTKKHFSWVFLTPILSLKESLNLLLKTQNLFCLLRERCVSPFVLDLSLEELCTRSLKYMYAKYYWSEKKIQAPSGLTECFRQSGQNSCSKMMVEKSTAERKLWTVGGAQLEYPNQLHVREQQASVALRWKQVEGEGERVYIY